MNNWASGGRFKERGLRCNICEITKDKTTKNQLYLSSHCNGAGVDFDVKGMSASDVRLWVVANSVLLPYPIRLEQKVNWVHLDIYDMLNGHKVNYF